MSASFDRLMADIAQCRVCRDAPLAKTALPHEPRPVVFASPTAKILIVGQAPGTRVHKSGKPFTDPSGDRLRAWMGVGDEIFYDTSQIAIVPMGFCFPGLDAKGGDLPPRRECAPLWLDKLMAHFEALELILVIGLYAQNWHLKADKRKNLTQTVEAWRDFARAGQIPKIIPLPHPSWRNNSWIKKRPWFDAELVPYLQAEIVRLIA